MTFNVFDESPENELVLKEQQALQQQNKVLSLAIIINIDSRGLFSMNWLADFGIYGVRRIG
jgi:hypothetical protein